MGTVLICAVGLEPQKGSGKRIFPVAELFKPRGLKEERSDDGFQSHRRHYAVAVFMPNLAFASDSTFGILIVKTP